MLAVYYARTLLILSVLTVPACFSAPPGGLPGSGTIYLSDQKPAPRAEPEPRRVQEMSLSGLPQ